MIQPNENEIPIKFKYGVIYAPKETLIANPERQFEHDYPCFICVTKKNNERDYDYPLIVFFSEKRPIEFTMDEEIQIINMCSEVCPLLQEAIPDAITCRGSQYMDYNFNLRTQDEFNTARHILMYNIHPLYYDIDPISSFDQFKVFYEDEKNVKKLLAQLYDLK